MNFLDICHFLNPRRGRTPMQALPLPNLHTRHGFENAQNQRFFNFAAFDLAIAMGAFLQDQLIRLKRIPKALIIHGCKPLFNFVQIFEFSHASKVPNSDVGMQKTPAKRGWV